MAPSSSTTTLSPSIEDEAPESRKMAVENTPENDIAENVVSTTTTTTTTEATPAVIIKSDTSKFLNI